MAQEYSKRKDTKFGPELEANRLAGYTVHILHNKKYFPDVVQETLVPELISIAMNIAGNINRANRVNVRPSLSKEERRAGFIKRMEYENKALEGCELLKDRIKTLKIGFHLSAKKANSWTRNINKTKDAIQKWMDSERKYLNGVQ